MANKMDVLLHAESEFPVNAILSIIHSVFVKGDETSFEIEASFGVEASELYPDFNYTTVDEYLDPFVGDFMEKGLSVPALFGYCNEP
jgi:hypothetical protein